MVDSEMGGDPDHHYYMLVEENGPQSWGFWQNELRKFGPMEISSTSGGRVIEARKMLPDGSLHYIMYLGVEDSADEDVSMQVATGNAMVLEQILGIDSAGQMNPVAFAKLVDRAIDDQRVLSEFTRDPETRKRDGGPTVYDQGLGAEAILNYLLRLQNLADYCIRQECDVMWFD